MDDTQLIRAYCEGDTRAFNMLVERWQHRIHRVAYRYFDSHDEAMEITQKTFIRVYKNLRTLDDRSRFPAWIYRIANNLCLDESKRAGRRRSSPIEQAAPRAAAKTADGTLEQKECEALLQQALQQLPPEQRLVVIMKEYEGLKFREIAEVLDLPESTVKSRMYYGLRALRGIFDQWNINKEALYYE